MPSQTNELTMQIRFYNNECKTFSKFKSSLHQLPIINYIKAINERGDMGPITAASDNKVHLSRK
jgi:hypothetical protein